jgi:hypothetical protein
MVKRRYFISILLGMVFLAGSFAPVPECYVTRVVCPVKRSIACAILGSTSVPHPSVASQCCAKADPIPAARSSQCPLASQKSWMKPYAPAYETTEAPVLPSAFLPVLFYKPVSRNPVVLVFDGGKHRDMPDPIPILLRKQSFLI